MAWFLMNSHPLCHLHVVNPSLPPSSLAQTSCTMSSLAVPPLVFCISSTKITPSAWSGSHQGQVETTTYSPKFMAAHHVVEQMINIFAIPSACSASLWMDLNGILGDNQAIVNSMTVPHLSLLNHWNALSYPCCHKALAAGFVSFEFLPGCENPSNILTKPLHWAKAHVFVGPLLLWKGETMSSGSLPRGE